MRRFNKLITILLIETFFLSSVLPFNPQDLFAETTSKLAPPSILDEDGNNGSGARREETGRLVQVAVNTSFANTGGQVVGNAPAPATVELTTLLPAEAVSTLGLQGKPLSKESVATLNESMQRDASLRKGVIGALSHTRLISPELFIRLIANLKRFEVWHKNLFSRAVELVNRMANVFETDITINGVKVPLMRQLASMVELKDEIARIPAGRKLDRKQTEELLSITEKVSRAVYLFSLKNPKFSELNLYESVCFVNEKGIRRLGIVLTPMARRAFYDKWKVVMLTPDKAGRCPKEDFNISDIEMLSDIAERLEENETYKYMLKFKAESLLYTKDFGEPTPFKEASQGLKEAAMSYFMTLASSEKWPGFWISEVEKEIGEFSKSWEFTEFAERLKNSENVPVPKEELDEAFNRIMSGYPELLNYLQFTGDITGTWYNLLNTLKENLIVAWFYYYGSKTKPEAERQNALKNVAQIAYEHSVVSAWIQAHRHDFRSPLGERPADTRIYDFYITMTSQSLGEPGAALAGFEAMEYTLCNKCATNACGFGQEGSLALRFKNQASFINGILNLTQMKRYQFKTGEIEFNFLARDKDGAIAWLSQRLDEKYGEGKFSKEAIQSNLVETELKEGETIGSFLNGLLTKETQEDISGKLRENAAKHNIAGDERLRREPNIELIEKWLAMDKAGLEQEREKLLAEFDEIWKRVKTQESRCPLHLPINILFDLMAQGKIEEAMRMLMNTSFGGAYLGLICPQEYLCQAACTFGKLEDRPVPIDIGKLEYLIFRNYFKLYGKLPEPRRPEDLPPHNGKYAAVIGAGPAGLQEAYDLARAGYKVVVFEHLHKAGGVLGYGIPTFRLQEGIVEEHIRYLEEEMGVKFERDTPIGEDNAFTMEQLRRIFDVVFISSGAGKSKVMEYKEAFERLENLPAEIEFPETLKYKIIYDADKKRLISKGAMSKDEKEVLLKLSEDEQYRKAVERLYESSNEYSPIPGRHLNGIFSAYHFLSWTFLMKAMKPGYKTPAPLAKRVLDTFSKSIQLEEIRGMIDRGVRKREQFIWAINSLKDYGFDESVIKNLESVISAGHISGESFYEEAIPEEVIETLRQELDKIEIETTIVIEGVGNVAMDSARTALRWINVLNRRLGTNVDPNILFLYRRSQEYLSLKARAEELGHTKEEGIGVINMKDYELHQAIEYIGDEEGSITGIRCIRYEIIKGPKGEEIVKEKEKYVVNADQVVECLGTFPANETWGKSIPLNKGGYAGVDENMQVKGLDGSDGLASVYASGDAAATRPTDSKEAVGTAVLAAAQAKDAARHFVENYANKPARENRLENPEELFFKEKPYKMYEILEVREIAYRDVLSSVHLAKHLENGRQRIMEFVVYAPYLVRRIKPGQFFTVMSDETGEKIPLTYLGDGEILGTVRFAVQDAGISTVIINNMKAGDRFFSINGPAGKPSRFSGLVGDVLTIGLGGAIPTIVSIVRARAELDKEITSLLKHLGGLRDGEDISGGVENFVIRINNILSQIRLPMPDIIKEISDALDKKEFDKVPEGLKRFIDYAQEQKAGAEIIDELTTLVEKVERLMQDETLKADGNQMQAFLKYEVYPGLDRIWEKLEEHLLNSFISSVDTEIRGRQYTKALQIIKKTLKGGVKTKVILSAFNKNTLIYLEEIEKYIGRENIRENIYITVDELEIETGYFFNRKKEKINFWQYEQKLKELNPKEAESLRKAVRAAMRKTGGRYYSDDDAKTHFFFGYGIYALNELLNRSKGKTHYTGSLIAGPPIGMYGCLDEVERINQPDILNVWDVELSYNSTMFCIYGGCLYCILKTDEGTLIRGCLGPEFPGKRIDREAFINRQRFASPSQILIRRQEFPFTQEEAEAAMDNAFVALSAYNELTDRLSDIALEPGIENAVLFSDKRNGFLYAVISADGNIRLIPIYGEGRDITMKKAEFIKNILPHIDVNKLGIPDEERKEYALLMMKLLGLGEFRKNFITVFNIPEEAAIQARGSLLGLIETIEEMGIGEGESIAIQDVIDNRINPETDELYDYDTVRREFQDAVTLRILERTGNKIKNKKTGRLSDEYKVVRALTEEQTAGLPREVKEKLNAGRLKEADIEEIDAAIEEVRTRIPAQDRVSVSGILGGKRGNYPIEAVRNIKGTSLFELSLSNSAYQALLPVLRNIAKGVELPDELKDYELILVEDASLDKPIKRIVAIVLRQKTRTSDQMLWTFSDAPANLLKYLMNQAQLPSQNPFEDYFVEEITADTDAFLAQGVVSKPGSHWNLTGSWRDNALVLHAMEQCNNCLACYKACPDSAVIAIDSERGKAVVQVSSDFCKDCGDCLAVCPFVNIALRRISEEKARFLNVSMDSTNEGRAIRLSGDEAVRTGELLETDLDTLKNILAVDRESMSAVTKTEKIAQLAYTKDGIRYLATYLKEEKTFIIKPMRTLIVLGFESKNRELAESLRQNGFNVTVVLAQNQPQFKSLKDDAVKSGFKVYSLLTSGKTEEKGIARNVSNPSEILTELPEDMRLANPVTVNPLELFEPLGHSTFAKLITRIQSRNGTSLILASRPVGTKDEDLDRVLAQLRPSFDEQDLSSAPGGGLCPACGQSLGVKLSMEALKKYAKVVSISTGCLEVSSSGWPYISWLVNTIHGNYTASSAIALGTLKAVTWFARMGKRLFGGKPFVPLVFMGDGGFSIGLSVISTVLRNGNVLIVVSDNGRTANTGGQPSDLAGEGDSGPGYIGIMKEHGILIPLIAKAHPNVYYAMVNESDPEDYKLKMERAAKWVASGKGSAIIHSFNSACPTCWKAEFDDTMEQSKLALGIGLGGTMPFEQVNGRIRLARYPGLYDGKIDINSEYVEGTLWQLEGLVEKGLMTKGEFDKIRAFLIAKKQAFFNRALQEMSFGEPGTQGELMKELITLSEQVIESLVLQVVNSLPISNNSEQLHAVSTLINDYGVSPDSTEKIIAFRVEQGDFKTQEQFISVAGQEAFDAIFRVVASKHTLDETVGIAHSLLQAGTPSSMPTLNKAKTSPFTAFEHLEDMVKEGLVSQGAFDKIKQFFAVNKEGKPQYRRPPLAALLLKQGRWKALLKDRKKVEEIQQEINQTIEALLRQAEIDTEYFAENSDSKLFPDAPVEKIEEYKFKNPEEGHKFLVGMREAPKYDSQKTAQIKENNRKRKARLAKEPIEIRIHNRGGWGGVTAANAFAQVCGEALELFAQAIPIFGGERAMAPVTASLRISGRRIKNRSSVKEPDIVCVFNESLLKVVSVTEGLDGGEEPLSQEEEDFVYKDIVSSFRPGGILLLNSKRAPAEIRKLLEEQGVNTKGMRIFTVNATDIAGKGNPINIAMLAAIVKVSQITRLDLDTEVSIDYLTSIAEELFGAKAASANNAAMKKITEEGVIKTEGEPLERLRQRFHQTLLEEKIEPIVEKKSNRKVATITRVGSSSWAAAVASIASRVGYCPYYPIYPSTPASEEMGKFAEKGFPFEYQKLGSEDAVAAAMLGAAEAGIRTTTFTASMGLTYMLQHLPDMFGKRLPIVINLPVRAINIGTLSVFPDESDMVMVKDYGIFLRARNAQETYDMNIIAWRIAERMRMPVYVCYTGAINSHTYENLEVFTDYKAIDRYLGLPKMDEKGTILDQDNPRFRGAVTTPAITHEIITQAEEDLMYELPKVLEDAFRDFEDIFGVSYSNLTLYTGNDTTYTENNISDIAEGSVDTLVIGSGAYQEQTEEVVDIEIAKGRRVATLNAALRFPFPRADFRKIIKRLKPKVIVVLDYEKGAHLHKEVTSALYGTGADKISVPLVNPVVYGIGGRELSFQDIRLLYDTLEAFKVIRELGLKGKPVPIGRTWLEGIIAKETPRVSDVERYIGIQRRFEEFYELASKLNELGFMLTPEEIEALSLKEPKKPEGPMDDAQSEKYQEALLEYAAKIDESQGLIQSANEKLRVWNMILEAYQTGTQAKNPGINDAVFNAMIRKIASKISESDLGFYIEFTKRVIDGNTPGEINIGTLLNLIERAAGATGLPFLKRDVILNKLIGYKDTDAEADILSIFGDKYMFGARRKFDHNNNIHKLVIELSIRISRKLLESEKGTPYERLVAAECLLDLSQFRGDLKVAYEELNSLRALEGNPPQTERAKELLQINRERFKQL